MVYLRVFCLNQNLIAVLDLISLICCSLTIKEKHIDRISANLFLINSSICLMMAIIGAIRSENLLLQYQEFIADQQEFYLSSNEISNHPLQKIFTLQFI